ncbi:fibronectin type III domain-containing protein [Runella limosa]|uniref:fibronectin type III domain-containing protein n=1 Tax=Runella limosa TaxID=370978 RepID=UPI00068786B5|nr:fibronectin type III domain-containing protein [Runella limosa]
MKKLFLFLVFISFGKAFAQSEAPSNLAAVAVSSKQVNLSWKDNSNRELGFEIERSTTSETAGFSKLGEVAANVISYTDANPPANMYSYYRVRAKLTATTFSGYSNVVYAFPPVAPNISKIEVKGTNWIAITFKVQGGKENGNVVIQRRQGQGGAWSTIGSFDSNLTFYDDQTVPLDNTEYCYRVSWTGAPNEFSNIACATTLASPPNPPTNLSAVAVSSSQINLSWTDASNNESGFEVFRSTDNANFSKIADVGANATTYANTGLNASTRYYYYVGSQRGGTPSRTKSNTADATTQSGLPNAPARLTANATSSSQINLSWADLSDNETGFEIERSTDSRNYSKIADVGAGTTTYSNTGLISNTQYCYRVRAKNGAGNSGYTDPACATTQAPPVTIPRPPSSLTVTATSSSQINLAWTDNASDETGFEIERSTDGTNFAKIADVGANTTTYSNTGLNASTRYWYRVRAKNSAGVSSYTNVADATTQAPPVTIPRPASSLTATAMSSSQINLAWTDNASDETGFEIERSTDGTNFAKIADVGANTATYSNTGLNASTRYWYRVRAKNSAGASSYTNVADATTQAPPVTIPRPPSSLTATATSSSQINLAWTDNASDETGFEIERSTDGTNFAKIVDVGANTTSYSNTGLSASTRYWYRVRAKNSAGASSYTNVSDATTSLAVPVAPTNLTAELADYDQIRLTWGTLSNVTNVLVERSTSPNTGFAQITQQPATNTSYVDLGLNEQTTYYYRIRLSNAAGNSGYSNVVSVTTPEVVISVRPQLSEVGLTVVAYGHTLRIQNERFQPLEMDWKLMSLNGQPLKTDAGIVAGKQAWIHDLSALRGGVYVVVVNAENRVFSTKIVLN